MQARTSSPHGGRGTSGSQDPCTTLFFFWLVGSWNPAGSERRSPQELSPVVSATCTGRQSRWGPGWAETGTQAVCSGQGNSVPTYAHRLCRLSTGGRICRPGWGWGDQSLWAAWLLRPIGSGRVPQERGAEWVPGRAWLGGVSLRRLWLPGAKQGAFPCVQLETSGPALHLWV